MSEAPAEMVKCPHCYSEIDARASVCPHCQQRLKPKRSLSYALGGVFVLLGIGAVIFGFLLATDLLLYGVIAIVVGFIMTRL